jgi:hypothetical protein
MELSRRGVIRLAGAADLAAASAALTAVPASPAVPAKASQDFWRWCQQCQGLWSAANGTGGVCPAPGTAGHSQIGSVNYTLPTDGDLSLGRGGWAWCNRCQGLWSADSNTRGACPAGPGGHDGTGSGGYWPFTRDVSGQPNWRWCRQCQGLWFAANGTGGVCPAPGAAGHSLAGSVNYCLGW